MRRILILAIAAFLVLLVTGCTNSEADTALTEAETAVTQQGLHLNRGIGFTNDSYTKADVWVTVNDGVMTLVKMEKRDGKWIVGCLRTDNVVVGLGENDDLLAFFQGASRCPVPYVKDKKLPNIISISPPQ